MKPKGQQPNTNIQTDSENQNFQNDSEFQNYITQRSMGNRMSSSSAAMESEGDDSVIEVEVAPKVVTEIDLTDSPAMPKITKKTIVAKTAPPSQGASKPKKTINENLGQRQFLPDEEMKPEMRRVLQKKKEDF